MVSLMCLNILSFDNVRYLIFFNNFKAKHFGSAWNVHGNSWVTSTMRSWSYHYLGLQLQWVLESKHGEKNGRNIRC
jgi:hypothetical protein